MQWKSRSEWDRLKAGIDCSFCQNISLNENEYGFKAIELKSSIVRIPWNQYYRGWTIVALKRHANELFELSSSELLDFWTDVSITAKALFDIFKAAKINYNVWGSHCPHIHCHLFALTFDSDPSKLLNPHEKVVRLSPEEYSDFKASLVNHISKSIS